MEESRLRPHRLSPGHADRRAARHRPDPHHRHAAADHLRSRSAVVTHHAGRHLLRRAIRRLDHIDPGEHPRRGRLDRHLPRRSRDGEAGPRRRRARRGGAGLFFRRLRRHHLHRGVRPAARRHRAGIQLAGLFLADGARARHRGDPGARLRDQGDGNGSRRSAVRSRRHRRQQRSYPLHVRRLGTVGRHRLSSAGDRAVRHRRDHPQSGAEDAAAPAIQRQNERPLAEHAGLPRCLAAGAARHCAWFTARHPARRRRRARRVRELYAGEEESPRTRAGSARAPSRAWRVPNPPTTRLRRPRSFRC